MISNIRYQVLEERYLESAVDCINQVKNQSGTFNKDLGVNDIIVNKTHTIFDDFPQTIKTTIIALDVSKGDYVCGIFPGIDFCYYVEVLRRQGPNALINQKNQLILKLLEPLIALNYQNGEFLMGISYGVRTEYENQKIGQGLAKLFTINAIGLGYSVTAGVFYNPKSAHVILKQNTKCFLHMNVSQADISPELRNKIKNTDLYVLGNLIQENIPQTRYPPTAQTPNL